MPDATYDTIEFTRDGPVAWLRLNRPDKLNCFTIQMWQEMRALGIAVQDAPDIRALVVIGNGRAFSSGIDTSVFTGNNAARSKEATTGERGTPTRRSTASCVRKRPTPG